jgi:hypothetical protein
MRDTIQIEFDPNNKWAMALYNKSNPNKKHWVAIPYTSGDRIDYIGDNLHYNLNYCGCVSSGVLINIKNGVPHVVITPHYKVDRLHRVLKKYFPKLA